MALTNTGSALLYSLPSLDFITKLSLAFGFSTWVFQAFLGRFAYFQSADCLEMDTVALLAEYQWTKALETT
jgi:hypothetical protein